MSNGVETRAQIDTETMKGLLYANGGGAVALLALLPVVLSRPDGAALAKSILLGVVVFGFGTFLAIVHNQLRRQCSLLHSQTGMQPPAGHLFGRRLKRPTVCFLSLAAMWTSAGLFLCAVLAVAIAAFFTL